MADLLHLSNPRIFRIRIVTEQPQSNKPLLPLALFILQCKHALRGSHCLHSLRGIHFSCLSSQTDRYYTLGRFNYIQLGGIEMVILRIDDYIASSILLLLTPNIKDCRYDHVIDSSTIIDRHVLLSHHENILLAGVLPISITNHDDQSKNDTCDDMLLSKERHILISTSPTRCPNYVVASIVEKSLQLLSL